MAGKHPSRVSTLMIDCLDEHFEEAVAFWSEALGLPVKKRPSARQRYLTLGQIEGPLFVRLQRVPDAPGVHLDIETRDIRKEVARLEAAGAQRKYKIKQWWVLEDPSGTPFCIVRPESDLLPP